MIVTLPEPAAAYMIHIRNQLVWLKAMGNEKKPLSRVVVRDLTLEVIRTLDHLERELVDLVGESLWHPDDYVVLVDDVDQSHTPEDH